MADRKIRAGYYRRYDGKVFYLVTTAKDLETGEETVILRPYVYGDAAQYYTMSREVFSGYVEVEGKRKLRYRRLLNMIISEAVIENLEEDGLRGPIRKEKRERDVEYSSRAYQNAPTYYAYAKELCENYRFDLGKYRFCVNENRYAAISREDFAKLREDLIFLHKALKTVLGDYKDYFQERFVQGLSIRKYAEAHQINRGSVDHQQKKFFSALAQLLKERDEAEGKCRLRPQNN